MNNKTKQILIVGGGLSGSTLALELLQRGLDIYLIDNQFPQSSSRVAAGLLNPIVPKGVKKTWQCHTLFPAVYDYYQRWESLLNTRFIQQYPFLNIHANTDEAHEWRKRASESDMVDWITEDKQSNFEQIPRDMATWVNHCGRLDVAKFIAATQAHLEKSGKYCAENFDYSQCLPSEGGWTYGNRTFTDVVFCEGIGILGNPWFQYLFFDPTAGDILKVHIPHLGDTPCIIKQKQWIVPTEEKDIYLLGSNFHKNTLSHEPMREDADRLLHRAQQITKQTVTLIEHRRAVRPTVQQRRPYLGQHPSQQGLHVFNGLGAKGSSLCSWLSPMMANFLVQGSALHPEVDIARFT